MHERADCDPRRMVLSRPALLPALEGFRRWVCVRARVCVYMYIVLDNHGCI